jgi:hypothetical protein
MRNEFSHFKKMILNHVTDIVKYKRAIISHVKEPDLKKVFDEFIS